MSFQIWAMSGGLGLSEAVFLNLTASLAPADTCAATHHHRPDSAVGAGKGQTPVHRG